MKAKQLIENFVTDSEFSWFFQDCKETTSRKYTKKTLDAIKRTHSIDMEAAISRCGHFNVEYIARCPFNIDMGQIVLGFEDHDVYIMIEGLYDSYEEENFHSDEGWKVAEVKEKMVRYYVPKK